MRQGFSDAGQQCKLLYRGTVQVNSASLRRILGIFKSVSKQYLVVPGKKKTGAKQKKYDSYAGKYFCTQLHGPHLPIDYKVKYWYNVYIIHEIFRIYKYAGGYWCKI